MKKKMDRKGGLKYSMHIYKPGFRNPLCQKSAKKTTISFAQRTFHFLFIPSDYLQYTSLPYHSNEPYFLHLIPTVADMTKEIFLISSKHLIYIHRS